MKPLGRLLKDAAFSLDDEGVKAAFAKLPTAKLDAAQAKLVDEAMAEALLVNNVPLELRLNAVTWLLDREPRFQRDPRTREPARTARAIVDLLLEDATKVREALDAAAQHEGARRERLTAALDAAVTMAMQEPKGDAARVKKHLDAWRKSLPAAVDDAQLQRAAAVELLQRRFDLDGAPAVFDAVEGRVRLVPAITDRLVTTLEAFAEEPEEDALVCELARRVLPKLELSKPMLTRALAACTVVARRKKDKKALAVLARLG